MMINEKNIFIRSLKGLAKSVLTLALMSNFFPVSYSAVKVRLKDISKF